MRYIENPDGELIEATDILLVPAKDAEFERESFERESFDLARRWLREWADVPVIVEAESHG